MANYNYVAPIQYKSYSDMNKERLAAKSAQDADKLKRRSAGDKQKQAYLDQLNGLSTDGWATAHREEFIETIKEAKAYVTNTPWNEIDFSPVADALMRQQELGNEHAKLRGSQEDYESFMGPNALKYDGDLDWGFSATHDMDGFEERMGTFNNVGLINYENGIGFFPNPNYNPEADASETDSHQTMHDVLMQEKGATVEKALDGKTYVTVGGQRTQVSGSSFDVAQGGFGGLWNPDISPLNPSRPEVAFTSYSNDEESNIFVEHAKFLNRKVEAREEGFSYEEAQEALRTNILSYLNPDSPLANQALMFSAIHDYQLSVELGGTGQKWSDVSQDQGLIDIHGNPWERFAEKMVQTADLYDPDNPTGSRRQNEQDRLVATFGGMPVGTGQTYPGADPQFVRELGDEAYNWELALRSASDPSTILQLVTTEDVFDPSDGTTTKVRKLKEMGDGVKIDFAQGGVKFDDVPIDNVEVFPQDNIVIVYAVGYKTGDIGIEAGEAGDPWRYNPLFGGREGVAPFVVINRFLKDDNGEYVLAVEGQTDKFGKEYRVGQKIPHPDFIRLAGQFQDEMGYRYALEKKITEAEQRRI